MRTIASALVLAVAACTEPRLGPDGVSRSETVTFLPWSPHALDLLFIVDDSPAMADAQATLAAHARKLIQVLSQLGGGLPDLHLAVTTADGTGALHGTACLGPGAQWLRYARGSNGEVVRNFDGAIEDVFACMLDVGDGGPSLRQPFESMRRALLDHVGFARASSRQLVVIISDGDDCSLRDGASPPADPFACTEQAIACDEADLRAPGEKHHCRPRTGSPLVRDVDEYAQFLASDPRLLIAAAIGPASPVIVGDGPTLAASCTSTTASAQPAIRTHALLDGSRGAERSSLCAPDFSDVLIGLASLGDPISIGCFSQPVTDECAVTAIPRGAPEVTIARCDPLAYQTPCWTLRTDLCPHIWVDFGAAGAPALTSLRATCAVQ